MDDTRNTRNDYSDATTIARCRELLGDEADGLSDEEVDQIRRHADVVAHVIVEVFLEQRRAGVGDRESPTDQSRTDHLAAGR